MNQFLSIVVAVSIPLIVWTGTMIWWMSRTNSDLRSLKEDNEYIRETLEKHIAEDKLMQEQIQALAVQEANVGGMLSTMTLEIKQIRKQLEDVDRTNGRILELKLEKQSNDLIIRFGAMLSDAKREWGR